MGDGVNYDEVVELQVQSFVDAYEQDLGVERDQQWQEVVDNVSQRLSAHLNDACTGCLICLEEIGREEAIWSCRSCYASYHLVCAKRWSSQCLEDVEAKVQELSIAGAYERADSLAIVWCCPKCREAYEQAECPRQYRCFCGKVVNPEADAWVSPHSCGQKCGRKLSCEHHCFLMCHPGACPPCPKVVVVSCQCGKEDSQARRCAHKEWFCNSVCKRTLECQLHACTKRCHVAPCPPCEELLEATCKCGKGKAMRRCFEKDWQCSAVCGRPLPCGRHFCQEVCHSGECQPCASGQKTCPCGASTADQVTCVDQIRCCGQTCDKMLSCGFHRCFERCHVGACSPCRQLRLKRCRCGFKEEEMPCDVELLCKTKCRLVRSCTQHQCNRRCCNGQCPPCEKVCNRPLACKVHQCELTCHRGPCYPCPLKIEVSCFCGCTKIKVPCGRENTLRPPVCSKLCAIRAACDHANPKPHTCHYGPCPTCLLPCNKELPCNHRCPAVCHTVLRLATADSWPKRKRRFKQPPVDVSKLSTPCPPCSVSVMMSCLGEHETVEMLCHYAGPYECGKTCGRALSCGNHYCQLSCHDVKTTDCESCLELCQLPRPEGCPHRCILPCHPAPCPPCNMTVTKTCHCKLCQLYLNCHDWRHGDAASLESMLSCGNKCPSTVPCGHSCSKQCHTGACTQASVCPKKVTVRCACLKRSAKVVCPRRRETLECDQNCLAVDKKPKDTFASSSFSDTHDLNASALANQSSWSRAPNSLRVVLLIVVLFFFLYWWAQTVFDALFLAHEAVFK